MKKKHIYKEVNLPHIAYRVVFQDLSYLRGVEKQGSRTVTSAVRGIFRSDNRTRDEFLRLAHAPWQP